MCLSRVTTPDLSPSTLTIHVYMAGPAQSAKHLLTTTRTTHGRSTGGNFGLDYESRQKVHLYSRDSRADTTGRRRHERLSPRRPRDTRSAMRRPGPELLPELARIVGTRPARPCVPAGRRRP